MKAVFNFMMLAVTMTILATAFSASARSQMNFSSDKGQAGRAADSKALIASAGSLASEEIIVPLDSPLPSAKREIVRDSATSVALRQATIQGMNRVVEQVVRDYAPGSTQRLHSGKTINVTTMIDTDRSVAAWHSVNIRASFDERPIGGILSIHVGLAPVFGGIGAAVRSVNESKFDQAVDEFDDTFMAQEISKLAQELGEEYTAR
jgi:hypothetical protein